MDLRCGEFKYKQIISLPGGVQCMAPVQCMASTSSPGTASVRKLGQVGFGVKKEIKMY